MSYTNLSFNKNQRHLQIWILLSNYYFLHKFLHFIEFLHFSFKTNLFNRMRGKFYFSICYQHF